MHGALLDDWDAQDELEPQSREMLWAFVMAALAVALVVAAFVMPTLWT
jgi:hypothetical protein